jgi:hypothetical protein
LTAHGPDVISYNFESKRIIFWDDKIRSKATTIRPSQTFQKEDRMAKAIDEAKAAIDKSGLSAADKAAALDSLKKGRFQTRTHGSGNAKNSTFGDHQ